MESTRKITIPESHLPAKITRIRVSRGETVGVGAVLLGYSHVASKKNEDGEIVQETAFSELRCLSEGVIQEVLVKDAGIVEDAHQAVIMLLEPCSHAVQLHGLCALCGKDLAMIAGGADTSRATIPMDHTLLGLLVAPDEALRIEQANTSRLLKNRKLSLILDLDQTVIHATVDPTVGEWMRDPDNPNFPALKDIRAFLLPDSADTVYYVKLRPMLRPFLEKLNELYEMHIYTMGTRTYANEVAKAIDPEGTLFGERVLSRDESGSFSHKSLTRLFPYDQSMVVVVDDRADVWNWSPNLIKVRPYEFFLGIGDINAPVYERQPKKEKPKPKTETGPDEALNNRLLAEMQEEQQHELEEVVKKRPLAELAKLELQLEEQEAAEGFFEQGENQRIVEDASDEELPSPLLEAHRPILYDTDDDLPKLQNALVQLHDSFYKALDKKKDADVRILLPRQKAQLLPGVKICFSSIIPLATDPRSHPDYILATNFGATIVSDVTPKVTHVVAVKAGTAKVNNARRISHAWIVNKDWLLDSVYQWERKDEEPYVVIKTYAQLEQEKGREDRSEPMIPATRRRCSISIIQQLQQHSQQPLSEEENDGPASELLSTLPDDDFGDDDFKEMDEVPHIDLDLIDDEMDQEVDAAMAEDDSDESDYIQDISAGEDNDPPLDEDELDAEIFGLEHPKKRKRSVDSPDRGEKRLKKPSVRQRMAEQMLVAQPTANSKKGGSREVIERLPSPPVETTEGHSTSDEEADDDSDTGVRKKPKKSAKERMAPVGLTQQADLDMDLLAAELEADFDDFEDDL
jgi:RNA polymerase II subunit A-like phosphatase